MRACRPDAHLILTLGDRTVRRVQVPTALITRELLSAQGVREVVALQREIPRNKRIANRNVAASTIRAKRYSCCSATARSFRFDDLERLAERG